MIKIGLFTIFSKKSGGNVYKNQVVNALSEVFNVEYINLEAGYFKNRYLRALESIIKLLFFQGKKDIWIRDFYSTITLNKRRTKGKNLSLIFHTDFSGNRFLSKILLWLLDKTIFYGKLRQADGIVTISEYWKNFFLRKGYKNVYKVYCGFDLNIFNIRAQELLEFKKKYKLEGKPIIYLGNCQKAKGIVESYNSLKELDVFLVTSGEKTIDVPAMNFNKGYREYLILLKASDVVVTMSKFEEGWCITAHEAMLLKTPVIGSGKGGMKELLEGGKQIVCPHFKDLKKNVEFLLNNPEKRTLLGKQGYQFAKEFTMERFKKEWVDLINKIL